MRRLKPFQPSVVTTGAAVATTLVVASVAGEADLLTARGLHKPGRARSVELPVKK